MKRLILILLIAQLSCETEETSLEIKKDFMSFKSSLEFIEISAAISQMSDLELDEWEKQNSFVSMRSALNKAYEEASLIESEEGLKEFLKKYDHILYFEEDGFKPRIGIQSIHPYINSEGYYEVGGYLHRVMGDFIISCKGNNSKQLRLLSSEDEISEAMTGFKVSRFKNFTEEFTDGRVAAACGTQMFATYFKNESGCKDDREVNLFVTSFVEVVTDASGTYNTPRVEIIVQPRRRYAITCHWNGYDNPTELRNTSFTIRAWQRISYTSSGTTSQIANYSVSLPYVYQSTGNGYKWNQPIGDWTFNEPVSAFPFTTLHAEGKSQGVGVNGWAIIDCQ